MKEVNDIILENHQEEQKDLQFFNWICDILQKYEGKQITKRLETFLRENLEKIKNPPSVSFRFQYGMQYICVWDGDTGRSSHNPINYLLRYDTDRKEFSLDLFRERNPQYSVGIPERQAKREEFLSLNRGKEVEDAAKTYVAARESLIRLMKDVPDSNDIYTEYGIDSRHLY